MRLLPHEQYHRTSNTVPFAPALGKRGRIELPLSIISIISKIKSIERRRSHNKKINQTARTSAAQLGIGYGGPLVI